MSEVSENQKVPGPTGKYPRGKLNKDDAGELVGLRGLANRLRRFGITVSWLKEEAEAGRIPCLRVGKKRLVFDAVAVERCLLERARESREGGSEEAKCPK